MPKAIQLRSRHGHTLTRSREVEDVLRAYELLTEPERIQALVKSTKPEIWVHYFRSYRGRNRRLEAALYERILQHLSSILTALISDQVDFDTDLREDLRSLVVRKISEDYHPGSAALDVLEVNFEGMLAHLVRTALADRSDLVSIEPLTRCQPAHSAVNPWQEKTYEQSTLDAALDRERVDTRESAIAAFQKICAETFMAEGLVRRTVRCPPLKSAARRRKAVRNETSLP